KTGARPTARSQDNPNGVGRFGGQARPRPDPTPASPRNVGSRAGALTHILPADSERPRYVPGTGAAVRRTPGSGQLGPDRECGGRLPVAGRPGLAWHRAGPVHVRVVRARGPGVTGSPW